MKRHVGALKTLTRFHLHQSCEEGFMILVEMDMKGRLNWFVDDVFHDLLSKLQLQGLSRSLQFDDQNER